MKTRIINSAQVRDLLSMPDCIDVISDALKILALGNGINPLRQGLWLPDKSGILGMMPAYLAEHPLGAKVVSVFPGNESTKHDVHQGVVLLFETNHGCLQAIVDASEITAIRTGAASGVATQLLSREDSKHLAILGSGVQARAHLAAMLVTRDIESVKVWSRTLEHAHAFADREGERHKIEIQPVESAQDAVQTACIVCTTTASHRPILQGAWLKPGTHVNAIGASARFFREVDTAGVLCSSLFVDLRESTLNEAGEYLIAKEEGAIQDDHIRAELGEVLTNQHPGRTSPEEITLFKGLGLGIYDIAAADHVFRSAEEKGIGTTVEIG